AAEVVAQPVEEPEHRVVVRDADHRERSGRDRLAGRGGEPRALADEVAGLLLRTVPDGRRVPVAEERSGQRPAHEAETEDCYVVVHRALPGLDGRIVKVHTGMKVKLEGRC